MNKLINQLLLFFQKAHRRLLLEINKIFRSFCNLFPISYKLTIVTGASSNHFRSLLQLLESIRKYENADVIVWDLGLTHTENAELLKRFPHIKYFKFDYSKYPDYFNIAVNAGEYAWKPVIIKETYDQCATNLLWMDAGCVIDHRLNAVRYIIRQYGFYSPFAGDTIESWTHKKTQEYFKLTIEYSLKPLISAGIVGVAKKSNFAQSMLSEWYNYSFVREAIAPVGSNRQNHRQDLSLLSIIYYKYNKSVPFLCRSFHDIKAHQDI